MEHIERLSLHFFLFLSRFAAQSPVKVTPENVKELFSEYPIVCEAFDRPDQKAMLVRELLIRCPKTTVVSGNGMAGYADTNEIRTQQMMQRLYVCGDQGTEASEGNGLIAPRVAACAAHQANKVLQSYVTKKGDQHGRQIYIRRKRVSESFYFRIRKYNLNLIKAAVEQGGAEIITLALRRAIQRRVRTSWILFRKGLHCFRTHPEREMQKRLCGLQD